MYLFLESQPATPWRGSCDILSGIFREHLVDQRLIADFSSPRFFAEALEDVRVHANRDQLTFSVLARNRSRRQQAQNGRRNTSGWDAATALRPIRP